MVRDVPARHRSPRSAGRAPRVIRRVMKPPRGNAEPGSPRCATPPMAAASAGTGADGVSRSRARACRGATPGVAGQPEEDLTLEAVGIDEEHAVGTARSR